MTEVPDSGERVASIAVLDDDATVGKVIALSLRKMQCTVRVYTDAVECLADLRKTPADILITDLRMPKMDGMTVLRKVKDMNRSMDVIMVTGYADKAIAIQALKAGAFDFFEKPINPDELVETVKRTVRYQSTLKERNRLAEQLSALSEQEAKQWGIDAFVAKSKSMRGVLQDIRRLQTTSNTSVMIIGESGTGKELVARAIHFGSSRSSQPFIPVNCPGLAPEMAESILFGRVDGSTSGQKGCFAMASGGTLFLDDIGDMPPALQSKILRVLEDGVVVPVGSAEGFHVDVRVISATDTDLKGKVSVGTFRKNLYYRLSCYTIEIRPLRVCREDILPLAHHFARKIAGEMGVKPPNLGREVLNLLRNHDYPGNARELRNVIERALIESDGGEIKTHHLHFPLMATPAPIAAAAASLNFVEAEAVLVRQAMTRARGNVSEAARLLGMNRTKLYRKLASLPK